MCEFLVVLRVSPPRRSAKKHFHFFGAAYHGGIFMPANASCTMVVRMSCSDIFAAASFCIVPLRRLLFATTEGCTRNLGLNGLASALQTARLAYEVDTPPLRTHALSLFVNHRCRRTTFYALMRFNSPRFICMGSAESDTRVLAHAGLHLLFYRPGSLACFWTSLIPDRMHLTRALHTHAQTSSQWT